MNFPSSLIQNTRPKLPKDKILLRHYVYARHKEGPGGTWDSINNIPDFTKIKIPETFADSQSGKGQSFNWSSYSIPIWTRFDNAKKYLEHYGVVAYSVKSIRKTGDVLATKSDSGIVIANDSLDVEHSPNPNNYSHCHLAVRVILSRAQRREARMAIKHNSHVPLYPNQKRNKVLILCDCLRMHWQRVVSGLINRLER